MEPIIIKTKTDEKERASLLTGLNAKGFKGSVIFLSVCLAFEALLLIFTLADGLSIGFTEILLFVFTAVLLVHVATGQYRMRRIARSMTDEMGENEKVYSFGEDGFVLETSWKNGADRSEIGYGFIERIRETKDYLFIFTNRGSAYGFKKADVPGDMLPILRRLISKKLPQEKYEVVS